MPQKPADEKMEALLRKVAHTTEGRVGITKLHVRKMIKSRAAEGVIGSRRADKVWGWVARAVMQGRHRLRSETRRDQAWMTDEEITLLTMREEAAWEGKDPNSEPQVERTEVVGSVRAWLEENEQQTGGTILLRPQKLTALKAAKKALTKERGGRQALMAAITILCANGEATLSQEPTKPQRRGKNRGWRQDPSQ